MGRIVTFLYGLAAYGVFFGTFVYAIGFVENVVVPKSVDSGLDVPGGQAIVVNILLLGLFGLQHSVMARPRFKRWWTRFVPPAVERSTFVLLASLLLALMMWQWRPMPSIVWHIAPAVVRAVLIGLSFAGWALVLYGTFVIDHFDLFGLRQVFLHLRGIEYTHPPFVERSVYKFIRHPLMLGFIIAFWAAPTMTQGRLLFAAVATGYILVGIRLEERDLLAILGEDYRLYRMRTPMLLPFLSTRRQ
jgi:protein-S-isoprenylcysteine O-methyltransferase Ste14